MPISHLAVTRVSPALRDFVRGQLPGGVDPTLADEVARKVARSPAPAATLDAELAAFGLRFPVDAARTFQVAALVAGDPALAELGSVFEAHKGAVAALEAAVAQADAAGRALEAQNRAKVAEVQGLVQGIAARKGELEAAREAKRKIGLVGIFLGKPMVGLASLVQMINDDARLKTLNESLAAAQATQAHVEGQLAVHQAARARLEGKLTALRETEAELRAGPEVVAGPVVRGHVGVASAAATLQRREALQDNLRAQLALLEAVRDSAAAVGANLDAAIGALKAELAAAEKLVEAARKDLLKLVQIATSPDPEAAATKWLEREVAAKTQAMLRALGLDVNAYIEQLVKQAFPVHTPEAEALRKALIKAFQQAVRAPA
jgi:DNA repair exonuclease SbcCD ATPase subunit